MNTKNNIITILIADSDFGNISMLGKRLKIEGFNVLTAFDGKQAAAITSVKMPDLVIIDEGITNFDEFLNKNIVGGNAHTPFFVFKNPFSSKNISEIKDDTIISKPYIIEDLILKIDGFLLSNKNFNQSLDEFVIEKRKILLVEDNELNQVYILAILNNLGYDVDISDNGEKALDHFLINTYDLILTDINVPLISGIQLTEIIRNKYFNNIPIIAITGHIDQDIISKCLSIGMNGYLTKPFQASELKQIIEKELNSISNDIKKDFFQESNISLPKKYDYSQAITLANGDMDLFKKWLDRFLELVSTAVLFINECIELKDFSKKNKVFHELINYSGYFGVDDLRLYIKELQIIQKFSTDSRRLENFHQKIKYELNNINNHYKDFDINNI